MEETSF